MTGPSADRCTHAPPHEHRAVATAVADPDPEQEEGGYLKAAALATYDWFKTRPIDRLPLLGGGLIFAGGMILNHFDVPWWAVGMPTIAGGITAYAIGVNKTTGWTTIGLTTATLATGGWLGTVAEVGMNRPLFWTLVLAYSAGYGIFRWARKRAGGRGEPETVAEDVERINWDAYLDGWGLSGAQIIKAEPHRLGERVRLNTKGTGRRASHFVSKGLEERIAEDFDLPTVRVSVTTTGLPAGQLEISVQLRDPWGTPVLHPLFDPAAEITLTPIADVTKPLAIGMDPETGEALTVVVWDEDGGKQTYIVGVNGGGKSVALNDIIERLTAASNAVVWGINLSKAQEMRRWAPSLDLAACGPDSRRKARAMVSMARKLIDWRGAQLRETSTLVPSSRQPLLVLIIDELDAALEVNGGPDSKMVEDLGYIASKGRSEAVVLILAGQRAKQVYPGFTKIRSQMTNFVYFKTANHGEVQSAVGDGVILPDIGAYGGQKAGVVGTLLKSEGIVRRGRTFALAAGKDAETGLAQIDRIAEGRPPNSLEGGAIVHLGEAYAALKRGEDPPTRQQAAQAAQAAQQAADSAPAEAAEEDYSEPLVSSSEERLATITDIRAGLRFGAPKLTAEGKARLIQMRRTQQEKDAERDAAATSPMNPHTRETLIAMLKGRRDGLANAEVQDTFKVSDRTALRYLQQLAAEGVAERRGQGPATRWFPTGNEHVA